MNWYENRKFGIYGTYTSANGINSSKTPTLLIHSKDDKELPTCCSALNYLGEIENPNVRVLELEDKGHYVFKSDNAGKYIEQKKWDNRYIHYEVNIEIIKTIVGFLEENIKYSNEQRGT